VFVVVAYHLGELSGGFLGVDLFFVISGFLITRLLLLERESTGRIDLRSFWSRRFRRLLPALLAVLVAAAVGSKLWLPAWLLGSIRNDSLAALAYVANWRFIVSGQSYFATGIVPSPVRHTWSLAIEEQYYLIWPLVVGVVAALSAKLGLNLRRLVALVSAAGAVGSALWMATAVARGWDLSRIYYGTDTRAFALFGGALLAALWEPSKERDRTTSNVARSMWSGAGVVALAAIGAAFFMASTSQRTFYQGGFQLVALMSIVLIVSLATGFGPLAKVFEVSPLVWLGRRSYGIYLWSWPVQVFASEGFKLSGGVLNATVVALSVGLAIVSHWLIEEPVRTARAKWTRKPVLSFGAVGVVAVLVTVTAIGAPAAPEYATLSDDEANAAALAPPTTSVQPPGGSNGGPSAEGPTVTAATTAVTTTIPIDGGSPGPFSEAPSMVVDPVAQGDPASIHDRALKVLLVGDSVGWSLGFRVENIPSGIDLSDRALIGCGLHPQYARFIVGNREPEEYPESCLKQDEVEQYGLDWGPDVVLLWFGAWEIFDHEINGQRLNVGTPEMKEALETRIQDRVNRYRSLGLPTLIAALGCFGPNATRLGNERHDRDRIDWVNARIRAVAKRNRGWVRIIDPTKQICEDDLTAREKTPDGEQMRPDGAHFVATTASWFWNEWLAGQIAAALSVPPPRTTEAVTD